MQKILGYIRRACQEFDLIEDGDRIAVHYKGFNSVVVVVTECDFIAARSLCLVVQRSASHFRAQ